LPDIIWNHRSEIKARWGNSDLVKADSIASIKSNQYGRINHLNYILKYSQNYDPQPN